MEPDPPSSFDNLPWVNTMKAIIIISVFLLTACNKHPAQIDAKSKPMSEPEIQEQFPDLSKALPGGKIIHQADDKIMLGYRFEYGADLDFENSKKKLTGFLGKGWKEKISDPEARRLLKLVMKQQGVELEGYSTFTNPALPGHEISLIQKKEELEGRTWCVVDISGSWNKAEERTRGNQQ